MAKKFELTRKDNIYYLDGEDVGKFTDVENCLNHLENEEWISRQNILIHI